MTTQKHLKEELIDWLTDIAGGIYDGSPHVHWIIENTGEFEPDQSLVYCGDCCEAEVNHLNQQTPEAEYRSDGGFGTQEDGFKYCEKCSCFLTCSLTDYGITQGLEEFEQGHMELSGEYRRSNAALLLQIAEGIGFVAKLQDRAGGFFARLHAMRLDQVIAASIPSLQDVKPEPPVKRRARTISI